MESPPAAPGQPGEHNGTFPGNNPAFLTATAALDAYLADDQLEKQTLLLACAMGETVLLSEAA